MSDSNALFESDKIKVGVSGCLIGQEVRYDSGHKRHAFVAGVLDNFVEFVPVCPEVGIGLGIPRDTIRLVAAGNELEEGVTYAAQVGKTGEDLTDRLVDFTHNTLPQLQGISAYVVCAKSPSCGMERVPVYREDGKGQRKLGVGIYTRELMKAMPLLPVEENGRLNDVDLRENFVIRLYAYHDWQKTLHKGLSVNALQAFHRRHKYLLLAHNQSAYRALGPIVANAKSDLDEAAAAYIAGFMKALSKPASRRNHCNTLMHIQGYFKQQLRDAEKAELNQSIHDYHQGILPLMAPLTLLRLFTRQYDVGYIAEQSYLSPYPAELRLNT